jgi:hypothetical protein
MLSPIIQRALVAALGTLTTSDFVGGGPPLLLLPLDLDKFSHHRFLIVVYNLFDPISAQLTLKSYTSSLLGLFGIFVNE